MTIPNQLPKPIFLLSPCARCGTNYLRSALLLHPDLAEPPRPFYEDHFLKNADLLQAYAKSLTDIYRGDAWLDKEDFDTTILSALGDGLKTLLYSDAPTGKRIITKTPGVAGVDYLDRLFPDSDSIFLIRDGRAVVASIIKTFSMTKADAILMWRNGVRKLMDYVNNSEKPATIIKYERLVRDEPTQLKKILTACDLDPGAYPYQSLVDLPVIGSSVDKGTSNKVHWNPIPKPDHFNPLDRFSDWSETDHAEFDELAGEEMRALGYSN